MLDAWTFALVSIPTMIVLGLRHALDVDHITAIDNLVRLHNAENKSRWVGAGFSSGHMISVLAEMIFIIYVVGGVVGAAGLQLWGGVIGALALGIIGSVNLYSMKKYGKTGSAIFASRVLARTGMFGSFRSAFVIGLIFGLGFDTATQISAITLSAVTSATAGVQVALILSGFFALGMIPIDTLDSIVLRSAFHRIFDNRGFRYMSFALSGSALAVAALESYSSILRLNILPEWTGATLAGSIIASSFAYGFIVRNKRTSIIHEHRHEHGDGDSHIHIHEHRNAKEQEHEHEHQYEHDIDIDGQEKDKTKQ
jgi:nickel/cobalt transporter (NiCoT) family protein